MYFNEEPKKSRTFIREQFVDARAIVPSVKTTRALVKRSKLVAENDDPRLAARVAASTFLKRRKQRASPDPGEIPPL